MEVTLRPVHEQDLDVFDRERLTPEGTGQLQWFGHRPGQALRARFAENGLLNDTSGRLTIDVEGKAAGWMEFWQHSWGPVSTSWCWTFGVCVLADFRGQGVGTQAQRQLADYLFAHTRAERIQACTDVANLAEHRALEKAGFEREGVMRRAVWRGGGWHDQVLYSVVRP